jgi:hypothetical protein
MFSSQSTANPILYRPAQLQRLVRYSIGAANNYKRILVQYTEAPVAIEHFVRARFISFNSVIFITL